MSNYYIRVNKPQRYCNDMTNVEEIKSNYLMSHYRYLTGHYEGFNEVYDVITTPTLAVFWMHIIKKRFLMNCDAKVMSHKSSEAQTRNCMVSD